MRYSVCQSETKKEALQRKTLQDNSFYISRPRTTRSSKDVNYANSSCREDIDYALNIFQIYSILNFENNQILNSQTGTYATGLHWSSGAGLTKYVSTYTFSC